MIDNLKGLKCGIVVFSSEIGSITGYRFLLSGSYLNGTIEESLKDQLMNTYKSKYLEFKVSGSLSYSPLWGNIRPNIFTGFSFGHLKFSTNSDKNGYWAFGYHYGFGLKIFKIDNKVPGLKGIEIGYKISHLEKTLKTNVLHNQLTIKNPVFHDIYLNFFLWYNEK